MGYSLVYSIFHAWFNKLGLSIKNKKYYNYCRVDFKPSSCIAWIEHEHHRALAQLKQNFTSQIPDPVISCCVSNQINLKYSQNNSLN